MLGSLAIDALGLLGARRKRVTAFQAIGLLLMISREATGRPFSAPCDRSSSGCTQDTPTAGAVVPPVARAVHDTACLEGSTDALATPESVFVPTRGSHPGMPLHGIASQARGLISVPAAEDYFFLAAEDFFFAVGVEGFFFIPGPALA